MPLSELIRKLQQIQAERVDDPDVGFYYAPEMEKPLKIKSIASGIRVVLVTAT